MLKILVFVAVVTWSLSGSAQHMLLHRSDGQVISYLLSDVDSISFDDIREYATPRDQRAALTLQISTDSALYRPGSEVMFSFNETRPVNAHVRYMYGGKVLDEQPLTGKTWKWVTPSDDFRGYMVQVYTPATSTASEIVRGVIAVDVSSDWSRFPRYGFVASYGADKTSTVVKNETDWLNRCHINGVQYYDWHYRHHWPWGGNASGPMDTYQDLAKRTIYTSTVERYIESHHSKGMKCMFYNLAYGALGDFLADGVKPEWLLYKDNAHAVPDYHDLPDSWVGDIYLVDPGLLVWHTYIQHRNSEVYSHLGFDGFHIDQLGYRGTLYSYNGTPVDLPTAFAAFIRKMKLFHPEKRLVMNAVSGYAGDQIARTGRMDFLYNEVWADQGLYADLFDILEQNRLYSGGTLPTVFAAYMNYNSTKTTFNAPGVLLTDAVIFALGGSHLELGEHILCNEYFPHDRLSMSDELKAQLIAYYDFLTAYQNFLRDGGTLNVSPSLVPKDTSGKVTITGWAPQLGTVTSIAREKTDCTVIHLLNFVQANSLSWRDNDGSMPVPQTFSSLPLELDYAGTVHHVYVASPDFLGGVMQELDFSQEGSRLKFIVPNLKYWTMLVIE